tara:strand:+ start:931 stop:1416 length:486 start_codon:yes stop_codon:yes gene_type:complete
MGKYNNKIMAEFNPPRKWVLGRDLSYTTNEINEEEIKVLKRIGVRLKYNPNDTVSIIVRKGFVTDLASAPRALWILIAPFDIARAAIIHDLLYKNIRQYRFIKKDKANEDLVNKAKVISDKIFLIAMKDSEPKVSKWKMYCSWKAVNLFGYSSIVPNKDNI